MAKENKPLMRNRKGWKGYCWTYPDWQKKVVLGGLWDQMDWTNGEKPKKKVVNKLGNEITTW